MSIDDFDLVREANPLDAIEQVASHNDWAFDRPGEDEIAITVIGVFAEYTISFSWMEDIESLHLACSFGMRVPERRLIETMKLVAIINRQLVAGHFDLWLSSGVVVYRQTLPLNGGADANDQQIHYILSNSLEACERYYQAFQFVVWAGKTAPQALDDVLFETMGEA